MKEVLYRIVQAFKALFIIFVILAVINVISIHTTSYGYYISIGQGRSMRPTFGNLGISVTEKLPWTLDNIEYGDIVSFYSESLDKNLCKRVIGKPGDTISYEYGKVIRNGEILKENYILPDDDTYFLYPETCGKDEYYLLGDNRLISLDSRSLGCFSADDFYGKKLINFTLVY